jgi:outer membrane murein-binding lipoprotein Lpp
MIKKIVLSLGALLLAIAALTGCSSSPTSNSANTDQQTSNDALAQLQKGQPAHIYKYSQIRATLQAVEDAQATVTVTTTFFFNQGVKDPFMSCPSIGFPLASTTEITNPSQVVTHDNGNASWTSGVVAQSDPTGVFAGASTGTYVLCVNPAGVKYIQYWEGFVQTIGGPAKYDAATGQVVLTGDATVKVK